MTLASGSKMSRVASGCMRVFLRMHRPVPSLQLEEILVLSSIGQSQNILQGTVPTIPCTEGDRVDNSVFSSSHLRHIQV